MAKMAILGSCCDCGEDVPECTITLEAEDCAPSSCPPGVQTYTPLTLTYEIYVPYTDVTPTCSGTMTYDPEPTITPGLIRPIYRSDPCPIPPSSGITFIRYVIDGTDTRHILPVDKLKGIVCYYPVGSATYRETLFPAPGYECLCGGDGVTQALEVRAPTLELTTRYGTVTLTHNTTTGPFPAGFRKWTGMGTADVPMMATCDPGVAGGLACLTGPGTINVYYEAAFSPCGWGITAYWGSARLRAANVFGTPCYGAAHDYAASICEAEKALGCGNPYADCNATTSDLIDFYVPMPDIGMGLSCRPGQSSTFYPDQSFNPGFEGMNCATIPPECLSWDPVLFELSFDADCTPCHFWKLRRAHIFADGDTWTLAQ